MSAVSRSRSGSGTSGSGDASCSLRKSGSGSRISGGDSFLAQLHGRLSATEGGVVLKAHERRMRSYENACTGAEICDWLISHSEASSRHSAVKLGDMLVKAGLLYHVDGKRAFSDSQSLFRFSAAGEKIHGKGRVLRRLSTSKLLSTSRMDGYLYKMGGKDLRSNWKKRWMLIDPKFHFYYFKNMNDGTPAGVINLEHYDTVMEDTASTKAEKKKFYFFLSNSHDASARVYHFYAEDEEERTRWMEAIRKSFADILALQAEGRSLLSYRSRADVRVSKNWQVVKSLFVKVMKGKEFPAMDANGQSDPYVICGVGDFQARTRTIWKNRHHPEWDEEFTFEFDTTGSLDISSFIFKASVFDEDKASHDDPIGKVMIPLKDLDGVGSQCNWYDLEASEPYFVAGGIHLKALRSGDEVVVTVVECRNLAAKDRNGLSDPFVRLSQGAKLRYKTQTVKKNLNPLFNEKFKFSVSDGPIQVEVWDWDRFSKDDFMGTIDDLNTSDLRDGKTMDSWFVLKPREEDVRTAKAATSVDLGSLRLTLLFRQEMVLPFLCYQKLLSFLLEDNRALVGGLTRLTKLSGGGAGKEQLAIVLARIFEARSDAAAMISWVACEEIEETTDPNVIFRGNTLATKLIDVYQKMVGGNYLASATQATLESVYAAKKALELDPMRESSASAIKKNLSSLSALIDQFLGQILTSYRTCPLDLRKIYHALQQKVLHRFAGSDLSVVRYTVVSSFVFLRLFVAAINTPKLFGLMPTHPAEGPARTLTLISKAIMTLANMAEFGAKEPYMAPLNDVLKVQIPAFVNFIDKIADPTQPFTEPPDVLSAPDEVWLDRELARLYRYIEENQEALLTQCDMPAESVAKLTEILTEMKNLHDEHTKAFSAR